MYADRVKIDKFPFYRTGNVVSIVKTILNFFILSPLNTKLPLYVYLNKYNTLLNTFKYLHLKIKF